LEDSYIEAINALSKAINVRDAYTSSHSHQLVDWAEATARRIGCSEVEIDDIHWATLLHDIGKIGIPDHILLKPNKLSEDEWTRMRKHPEIGSTIVASIRRLSGVIPIIRCHHEHYDGEGYPEGLKQEEIPLGARILSVVDAYGAMVSERVYRKPLDPQTAVKELQDCAGTQFDPQVVKTFVSLLPEFTDNYCYTS
jgi:putative nucleotidyltransferase with HDIG domain